MPVTIIRNHLTGTPKKIQRQLKSAQLLQRMVAFCYNSLRIIVGIIISEGGSVTHYNGMK